jgi:hypothetical protein
MEGEEFKKFATAMMDYIVNYLDNIRDRFVITCVEDTGNCTDSGDRNY